MSYNEELENILLSGALQHVVVTGGAMQGLRTHVCIADPEALLVKSFLCSLYIALARNTTKCNKRYF